MSGFDKFCVETDDFESGKPPPFNPITKWPHEETLKLGDEEACVADGGMDFGADGGRDCGAAGGRDGGAAGGRDCGADGGRDCGAAGERDCGAAGGMDCGAAGGRDCGADGGRDCGADMVEDCGTVLKALVLFFTFLQGFSEISSFLM